MLEEGKKLKRYGSKHHAAGLGCWTPGCIATTRANVRTAYAVAGPYAAVSSGYARPYALARSCRWLRFGGHAAA